MTFSFAARIAERTGLTYDVGGFYEKIIDDKSQQAVTTVEQLLDEVENLAV